jgi:type II secretion system protein N
MRPSKKTLLYTAYVIGITIFFLWYLFPSDTLKAYLTYRLTPENSNFTIKIGRIKPVLPPGITLQDVVIDQQSKTLANLASLKIMPELRSLFSDKTAVDFKGRVYQGSLSGRVELGGDQQNNGIKIDADVAGIQLQQIPILKQLSDHEISGGLTGSFTYADTKPNRQLSGNLSVSNCRVILAMPVFSQKSFDFKDIAAELTLQNNRLIIKKLNAKGNQLDFDLAGNVDLNGTDPAANKLNLTGTVTPHHVFLAKIEKEIPVGLLRSKKAGGTAISFRVDGTMDEPGFSLN